MRKNLLAVLFIYFVANQAFTQGTITVDAGADQNACPNSCVQLSATAAVTGAGTSAYTVQQISYAPPPFNCGTPVNIAADDQWSPIVPIGFNFSFFGQTYSQLIMGANGIISFNTANAGAGCSWAIPAQPWPSTTPADVQNSITCPWHDIDPGVGGTFQYGLYGVAPFRIFAVTWNNVPMFSGACNAQLATHQIILYETTNVIETFIQNKPLCASWNGGQAIHGIQNATGTVAYIVPGRNAGTQWTATNDAWRFNPNGTSTSGAGVTFTWFNGATQIGTGANITVTPTQSTTYTVVATGPGGITATDQVVVNMSTLAIPTLSNTSICGTGSTNLDLTMPVVPPLVFTDVLPPTVYTPGSTLDVPINVTGVPAGSVQNGSIASVCVSVVQPIVGQLRLYLISPTGQQIDLSSNNGLASNGYNNVCFSPTATIPVTNYTNIPIPANSTLLPEQNFSLLNCSAINDIWILRVQHTGGGGSGGQNGTFNSVTLTFNNPLASTYNWSPAAGLSCTNCANPVATPTAATTYNVTVSAQNGCTATANVNVAVNSLAQPDVTAGANNNSATFNWLAVTGADHYEVSINGGAPQNIGTVTTFTQNGLTPGQVVNFSVVAIAATGSTCGNSLAGTATATASCPSVATSISGNLNICSGSNTTLTATAGFAGYLWSNGETTQAITINQANTYFVTVTNAQGCTGSASATVNSSTTQVIVVTF